MDERDLLKVITDSLSPIENLTEAYVAQPKVYTQATEFLSQRTKDAHIELYKDYIKKLNEVSAKLDVASRAESNHENSVYRSLKQDETFLVNAVYLHELYFANCFDSHSEIFLDTLSYMRLERDFGTFDNFQTDFIGCAQGARQGWAICGYNTFLKRFINTFFDGHDASVMVGLIPVIVVDVHEHAYFRDYLKDRKSYIVAMLKEINWEVVEERFRKLEKVHEALK